MVHVAIVGTGDLAYGLAHLFATHNSALTGNSLEVTKPNLGKEGLFHDTNVPLADFDDALVRADILILAIPSHGLEKFIFANNGRLKNKILVDVTNGGEDLYSVLGKTSIRWVKAFNDIGAVDIMLHKSVSKRKIPTKMCSIFTEDLKVVKGFAENSLGFQVKSVPFEQYHIFANHQSKLGQEWVSSTFTMIGVFAVTMAYNIYRHPIEKGYPWRQFPLFVMNKSICWTALWGFAIAQIPGMLARMSNAYYRDTLLEKSKCLKGWLAIRKHLGLISLWFLVVHIFMSCLMFSIAYYDRFFEDKDDPKSRMTSNGESSFMFGAFSAGLYLVMGIASLPSVAENMTRAQWDFVYGPVAWFALWMGTAHVMCQGIDVTWQKGPWRSAGYMPPITLVSTVFPIAVIALKFFQVLFVWCMDYRARGKKHYFSTSDASVSVEEQL